MRIHTFTYLLVSLMAMLAFTSCITKPENRDGNKKFYRVGDVGPEKGIVFYDKGFYGEDGWRYLEVAPDTMFFQVVWGLLGVPCDSTGRELGDGKDNAIIIEGSVAAHRVAQFKTTDTGATDWFIPSVEELNKYYEYILTIKEEEDTIEEDEETYYWTSTVGKEPNNIYTWFKRHSDGALFLYITDDKSDRNMPKKVVPIRAF